MNFTEKTKQMNALYQEMCDNKDLPLAPANLVFGEGSLMSKIFFIGEAPGAREDELVRPFVGRSGQLLTKMIESIGLKREDVYISNIVKRRPPENRDPLPSEIEAYSPYLKKQIEIIGPKVIVTLGRFSMNYFMPTGKITRDQGKIFRLDDKLLMPMFHPAAALRGTKNLNEFKAGFLKLKKLLDKGFVS